MMYGTDRVPGDTPIMVKDLRAGVTVRSFSRLHDTVTLLHVERQIMQGGAWAYSLEYSDGTKVNYVGATDVRYLPTGGPRPLT